MLQLAIGNWQWAIWQIVLDTPAIRQLFTKIEINLPVARGKKADYTKLAGSEESGLVSQSPGYELIYICPEPAPHNRWIMLLHQRDSNSSSSRSNNNNHLITWPKV